MYKHTIVIIMIIFAGLLLSSCAKQKGEPKLVNITTSFYPVYIFTMNITKDVPGIKVTNLTKPTTGCLHDYSLAPTEMKALESADIFVANGGGMESFLAKVTSTIPVDHVIDTSLGIDPISHDGEVNPHFFVSISDAVIQVRNIGNGLARLDAGHKAQYLANMEAYIARLTTLKDKMHAALDGIKNKNVITFHEAFPYFAREFGLNIVAVIEREPGSEPSAGELAETIKTINKHQIKAIFVEPQYSPKAAETIARETSVRIYTLDPAVTGSYELSAYETIMEKNLATLTQALNQSGSSQ
jgi:zinc transport system substrate-binding protein